MTMESLKISNWYASFKKQIPLPIYKIEKMNAWDARGRVFEVLDRCEWYPTDRSLGHLADDILASLAKK